jgi:hypothetical protein
VDNNPSAQAFDPALVRALVKLGYTKSDARERISNAWDALSRGSEKPKDEEILLAALRFTAAA